MLGHSRSKNGVASFAYVPGILVLKFCKMKDVDGRDEPGHDEVSIPSEQYLLPVERFRNSFRVANVGFGILGSCGAGGPRSFAEAGGNFFA